MPTRQPNTHHLLCQEQAFHQFWMSSMSTDRKFKSTFIWELVTISFLSVWSLSRVRLFASLWISARQASLSITNSWSLLKLMFIHIVTKNIYIICWIKTIVYHLHLSLKHNFYHFVFKAKLLNKILNVSRVVH